MDLLTALDLHGEDIEADLLQVFGVDVLDVGTPRLSWRRLWSLIAHLPRDSRYALATCGEQARWGYTEHLLALVIDVLQVGNWMFASAHSKSRVNKPVALKRPGQVAVDDGTRIGTGRFTVDQMREILDNWGSNVTDEIEVREV